MFATISITLNLPIFYGKAFKIQCSNFTIHVNQIENVKKVLLNNDWTDTVRCEEVWISGFEEPQQITVSVALSYTSVKLDNTNAFKCSMNIFFL